ncbi:MAG: DUF2357 domain-containing protein [Planctomycetes bacterium]|nr:DUF2357 domain-containing protein [Planctomycetota bacterium]
MFSDEKQANLSITVPALRHGSETRNAVTSDRDTLSNFDEDAETSEVLSGTEFVWTLLDLHLDFVNRLVEQPRGHRFWQEGKRGNLHYRSIARSTKKWRHSVPENEPRLTLIVRLARGLSDTLENVCNNPRVVLRRIREIQPVADIQEIDTACIRWLARQSGNSLAEKAGQKQRILGIRRIEHTDTPENRVVRDFLVRARLECRRYLVENQRFPNHFRVKSVRSFRQKAISLLKNSAMMNVRSLAGNAQPNYVLQFEPRYNRIWKAYQQLVRHQGIIESLWQWQHRVWTECCKFAVWSCLTGKSRMSPALRSDVFLQDSPHLGSFVSPETQIGPWRLSQRDCESEICFDDQRIDPSSASPNISKRGWDFCLRATADQRCLDIPIWCVIDANSALTPNIEIEKLKCSLGHENQIDSIHPLLLIASANPQMSVSTDKATALCLSLPVQNEQHILWENLRQIISVGLAGVRNE